MSLKILYLDDEMDICELFVDLFASETIDIQVFYEDQKAIDAAAIQKYDLAFLDYRLPGTTGIEVARKMDPKIPKVLITGDIHVKTDNEFFMIIKKPFEIKEVESLLHKFAAEKIALTKQI